MTQCSLTAKMKKAMHLQDMEVKNATEWKVGNSSSGWTFLASEALAVCVCLCSFAGMSF